MSKLSHSNPDLDDVLVSPSDRADMEPDAPVQDWNGKIYVNKPMPATGLFWIVTDEGDAVEVAYDDTASLYLNARTYSRQDGEAGMWEATDILGWTLSQEDAEEAAELLMEQV